MNKFVFSFALLFLLLTPLFIPLASAQTYGSGTTNTNAVITKVNSVELELSSKKYIETPSLIHIINTKINTLVNMSEGSATMAQQFTPTVTVTNQSNFNCALKSSFDASNVKGHKTIISIEFGVINGVTNNNLEKSMNNEDAHASIYMIEENVASLKQKALPSSAGELRYSNSYSITNSHVCSNSCDQNVFGNENDSGNDIGTNPGLNDQNAFGNENLLGNNIGTNPGLNDQNAFGNENLLDGLEYIISTRQELTFESFEVDDPSADIVADLVVEDLDLNYDLPDSYGLDYAKYIKANDISFTGGMMFKKNLP